MSDAIETQAPVEAPPQRKRLVLKPRDPDAAARLEAERAAKAAKVRGRIGSERCRGNVMEGAGSRGRAMGCYIDAPACTLPCPPQSPFGNAKPREAVIASRVGKSEEEILKEEVLKEKLHVRMRLAQGGRAGGCCERSCSHGVSPAPAISSPLPHPCMQLRLSPEQIEEKKAGEAAVKEIEDQLALEEDDSKRTVRGARGRRGKLPPLLRSGFCSSGSSSGWCSVAG